MPAELTRSFLEKVVRSSGWALSEVESLSLEGESISCLGDSFAGVGRLVYLSLARNNISSLLGVEHLSSLSTAILRANRVSSMNEVGRLARLPNLRSLDLRLNPIMASPTTGGGSNGSGSNRNVGGGGGGRNRGAFSEHDATTADAAWDRQGREGFFFTRNPREVVLKALPQLVNLDGQKVKESERRELRRRSAAAKPTATSADRHEEIASAWETRRVERRAEEAVGNTHRSSWPRLDSEVSYGTTDAAVSAPRASVGSERAMLGSEGQVVGATRSYDERDLRRVGTAPSRGRAASRYIETGVRKRDRTGAGVFGTGGHDEGVPPLLAGSSGNGGSRAVDEIARSQQRPVHIRRAADSRGGGVPPGAAPSTAGNDDLAALWSELGEGFLEFPQPRAAAAATAAGRSASPTRPQCVPDCRRRGCSGGACGCRDTLHSPAPASGHTQLFPAELDESMSAMSFSGASRQTRYGPRVSDPRLLSNSGTGTTELDRRGKGRTDEGGRPIEARSYADEWNTLGECDGDGRRGGGGGDGGSSSSFRGSSGGSRDDTNPQRMVSSNLVFTAPTRSSSGHGGNQETAAHVVRSHDAFSGERGSIDAVHVAEAKPVANPANRSNGGGEQREARNRRHPPAETGSARDVVGRQNPCSAAARGALLAPSLSSKHPAVVTPTGNAPSIVAVSHCTPPAPLSSSSQSTTTAAARAVEAFRRSSQRLGLVDASKTGSSSPATYQEGGGVTADECHGSVRSGPADAGSVGRSSPGPTPPVEVTSELDNKPKGASVGGGDESEHSRGTGSTRKAAATGGASSAATTANATLETSTALVLPPATERAVTSEPVVSAETTVSFLTRGVKCQECGANFEKGSDKDCGAAAASGAPAAEGSNGLHERWWAREREFTSRWAEREREFDARWTAREREFDKRRREESKEFTRGMHAMLFEAHNALIASNALLLARLQTVESARVPPPQATEPDANISATPSRGSTFKDVGAATIAPETGPPCPPPAQRAARRFVPDTSPTLLVDAGRDGQQWRQRKHVFPLRGDPHTARDAPSFSDDDRHVPGGATVTGDEFLPAMVTEGVGAGAPLSVKAGREDGTGDGSRGTGRRISQAPALEDGGDRGQSGEAGRVYRCGEALQQLGDARNSRPLVSGVDVDLAVVATIPRPKLAVSASRETRELPSEASELPSRIATISEVGTQYAAAAVTERRSDFPTPWEFATGRHSEEAYFDAEGVRGGVTGLERLVSVGDAVGAGRRREKKAGGSTVATGAETIAKVEGSSASTAAAAIINQSSGSYSGGAGGCSGGEASDEICDAPVPRSSGGSDRRTDGTGSAERVSAFNSAHAPVPAESERTIATLGEGNANHVSIGEMSELPITGGQKGAIVGGGVAVGASGGGNGRIVLGSNTTLLPSEERDKRDAVWRRDRGVGDSGALCSDPEVTTSAPDG